jgi:hypothetical protein
MHVWLSISRHLFSPDFTPRSPASFLRNELPPNIHLLSLQSVHATTKAVIVRLMRIDENPSADASADLSSLFSNQRVSNIQVVLRTWCCVRGVVLTRLVHALYRRPL